MIYLEEVRDGDDVPAEHEGHEVENLGTLFGGDAPATGSMPVNMLTAEDVMRYTAEKAAAAAHAEARQVSEAAKARGNAAFGAKRFGEALDAYSEAIELDGSNALLFGNRSATLLAMGDAVGAREDAARMVSLAPAMPKAHFRLGAACDKLGEHAAAAEHYSEALRLDFLSSPAEEATRRAMASLKTSNPSEARVIQTCSAALSAAKAAAAGGTTAAARRSMEWVRVDTRGETKRPSARGGASLTAVAGSLWLVGGANRSGVQDEAVWQYVPGAPGVEHSAGAWVRHQSQGDAYVSRNGHAAAACGECSLLVCGGKDGSDALLSGLMLLRVGGSGPSWSRVGAMGDGRAEHSLCWGGGAGWVFGGADESGLRADLLRVEEQSFGCSVPECTGTAPTARGMHCAAVVDGTMLIHGGRGGDGATPLDDLHSLCLRTLRWSRVETSLQRFGHAAAVSHSPSGSELVLFGGIKADATGATFYNDTWRVLHPDRGNASLERVRGVGEPARRFAHCVAALGSTVYVFGGSGSAAEMADLHAGEME